MKNANNPKTPKRPLHMGLVLTLVIIAVFAAAIIYFWPAIKLFVPIPQTNYAEEVAKPLEAALVKAGGVKKCSTGDPGRGPDNITPWYRAYFELSKDNPQTETIVKKITATEGYNIAQASAGTKGYLGDVVYTDNASKKHNFSDLENNSLGLAVALSNKGPLHACPESGEIFNDEAHTAISIELNLPPFKQ